MPMNSWYLKTISSPQVKSYRLTFWSKKGTLRAGEIWILISRYIETNNIFQALMVHQDFTAWKRINDFHWNISTQVEIIRLRPRKKKSVSSYGGKLVSKLRWVQITIISGSSRPSGVQYTKGLDSFRDSILLENYNFGWDLGKRIKPVVMEKHVFKYRNLSILIAIWHSRTVMISVQRRKWIFFAPPRNGKNVWNFEPRSQVSSLEKYEWENRKNVETNSSF